MQKTRRGRRRVKEMTNEPLWKIRDAVWPLRDGAGRVLHHDDVSRRRFRPERRAPPALVTAQRLHGLEAISLLAFWFFRRKIA